MDITLTNRGADVNVLPVGERITVASVQCEGCLTFWHWPAGSEPETFALCPVCTAVPIPNFSGSAVDHDTGGAWVGTTCFKCGKDWSLMREELPPGRYIQACNACSPGLNRNIVIAGLGVEPKKEDKRMASKRREAANGADRKEIDRYEESLPCKIPDEDIAEKAEALALVIEERDQVKQRRRAVIAQFKDRMGHLGERIKELGESVRLKTERRPVQCAEYLIDRQNKVEIIRLDTGETLKTRAATPEDRQEEMFGAEGKRKRAKKAGDTEPADPLTDAT